MVAEYILSSKPTKRLFGLRTVTLAFGYGAALGAVAGVIGGYIMGSTFQSDDLSSAQKMKRIFHVGLLACGGIFAISGTIQLVTMLKIKG
jgi:hypothetical protein